MYYEVTSPLAFLLYYWCICTVYSVRLDQEASTHVHLYLEVNKIVNMHAITITNV